jgi:hypothetical protein
MKKLFFAHFKQAGMFGFEIKEDNFQGKLIASGKNFKSRKEAVKAMNKTLKKAQRYLI